MRPHTHIANLRTKKINLKDWNISSIKASESVHLNLVFLTSVSNLSLIEYCWYGYLAINGLAPCWLDVAYLSELVDIVILTLALTALRTSNQYQDKSGTANKEG